MTSTPKMVGPLTAGRGWPFGCLPDDVARHGYVMEEFIVEGQATSYRTPAGGSAERDGYWDSEPAERAPYATRVYVVRPADPGDFNGVAVVNWQNVTAGFDLGAPLGAEILRGYAWVGVTTQKIGVDGSSGVMPGQPDTLGLREWDPERYGSLQHPGDAWSYDIFTHAGRLVRDGGLLGKLAPELVLASGGSQSAMRLGSYLNAAHQHDPVYDGFQLTVHWGICPPLEEMGLMAMFQPHGDLPSPATCAIRDDGGVPILVVATECEARFNLPVRQPETDTFRFWEIAGAAHVSPSQRVLTARMHERDGLPVTPPPPDHNAIDWRYVSDAGLRALVAWAGEGTLPRTHPRIEFSDTGAVRDEFGNVQGGIRVPEVAAPVASHLGERDEGMQTWLNGRTTPLPAKRIAALYPTKNARQAAWHRAVDALARKDLVLPEDVAALRARCETASTS